MHVLNDDHDDVILFLLLRDIVIRYCDNIWCETRNLCDKKIWEARNGVSYFHSKSCQTLIKSKKKKSKFFHVQLMTGLTLKYTHVTFDHISTIKTRVMVHEIKEKLQKICQWLTKLFEDDLLFFPSACVDNQRKVKEHQGRFSIVPEHG